MIFVEYFNWIKIKFLITLLNIDSYNNYLYLNLKYIYTRALNLKKWSEEGW